MSQNPIEETEKNKATNLCLMAEVSSIVEETEVLFFEHPISYEDLVNAYDKLLNNTQLTCTRYATLNKEFSKTLKVEVVQEGGVESCF